MQNKKISIFTKEYWKSQWKNALINASVYIGIFIIFALIDLLTKRNYYIPADYRDSEAIYSFGQPEHMHFYDIELYSMLEQLWN